MTCSTINKFSYVLKYQIKNKCVVGKHPNITNDRSVKLGTESNAQFRRYTNTVHTDASAMTSANYVFKPNNVWQSWKQLLFLLYLSCIQPNSHIPIKLCCSILWTNAWNICFWLQLSRNELYYCHFCFFAVHLFIRNFMRF